MCNPRRAVLLAILVLSAAPPRLRADEKLLFGFEKDDAAKLAKVEKADDASYALYHLFQGAAGDATEGRWALAVTLGDKYAWLAPGNKTTYYILQRSGRVVNAFGWLAKAMPTDWSGHRLLRMDVKLAGAGATLRLELEDGTIADPVVRTFAVPADKWVTLQADLAEAAKVRGLDLSHMATFQLLVAAFDRRLSREESVTVKLDNIRLADDADKTALPLVVGEGPLAYAEPAAGKGVKLAPLDLATQPAASAGPVAVVEYARKPSYSPLTAKDRLIGQFAPGGLLLMDGTTRTWISRDGGATWTDLAGNRAQPQPITGDVRGHRMAVLAEGREVLAAFVTDHCAGGSGRTELHFAREHYDGKSWQLGAPVAFERGVRHCADRLDLLRDGGGRIWVAWDHLDRNGQYNIRAKCSDDDGATWRTPDAGPLVAPAFAGIPSGPYLVRDGEQLACFWRAGSKLQWARFDGKAWGPPAVISGAYPVSVADCGGTLFLSTRQPDQVHRLADGKWTPDSPDGVASGLLCAAGDRLVCVWLVKGEGGPAIAWSVRSVGGKWSPAARVAAGQVALESLAVPQHSPAGEVPVAFSDVTRMAIRVLHIRLAASQ
ncbi:MAG: hypothetical protein BIFFINMI_01833 [Phycisphaerae bacterium]|nr:hypothetical protein [Phycisphaerae bacterium]